MLWWHKDGTTTGAFWGRIRGSCKTSRPQRKPSLKSQLAELQSRIAGSDSINTTISSAQQFLATLRKRLDAPLSWEQKRRLVEVLVAGVQVETVETLGVRQPKITVAYRFTEPDQGLPIIVPQSYAAGSTIRIPTKPQTIGDHVRKKRLESKMLQREVADIIGVDKTSVLNWEANTAAPKLRLMPAFSGTIRCLRPPRSATGWSGSARRSASASTRRRGSSAPIRARLLAGSAGKESQPVSSA